MPLPLLQTDPAAVPSMADLMTAMGDLRSVAKVGEGSYGEAFRLGRYSGSGERGGVRGQWGSALWAGGPLTLSLVEE